MIDIVVTLVFSIVMLVFMAFPAMKISEYICKKFELDKKTQAFITIFLDILFSIMIGIFLQYF